MTLRNRDRAGVLWPMLHDALAGVMSAEATTAPGDLGHTALPIPGRCLTASCIALVCLRLRMQSGDEPEEAVHSLLLQGRRCDPRH